MFNRPPFIIKLTVGLLLVILVIYSLIAAKAFLYPLIFAILISYLLFPIANGFEKIKIPRIFAILFSIFFAIFVVGSFIYLLSVHLYDFLEDIPYLEAQAKANIAAAGALLETQLGIDIERQELWLRTFAEEVMQGSGDVIRETLTTTAGTIAKIGIIPVFVFFMLYYRTKFKNFVLKLVSPDMHHKAHIIINDIAGVTRRYMAGVVTVIIILCIINSLGLWIIGMDYPILFGILSALMNFIPYFGTLVGGLIPLSYALFIEGSHVLVLRVIILFLIVQFLENNILTPNITGGQVNINPFITILTIILGGVIWGLPGLIVAVPLLGMFKILCDHLEDLEPYGYLLGTKGTEEHNITATKIRRFLKKLFRR